MDHGTVQVLMPLTIIGTFGAALVIFARTITDYILKRKMIEKGFVGEDAQALFKRNTEENKFASLKWGLIAFSGGLALIVMEYIEYDNTSPLPYGLFAMFISLGFLAYYFIVRKEVNK